MISTLLQSDNVAGADAPPISQFIALKMISNYQHLHQDHSPGHFQVTHGHSACAWVQTESELTLTLTFPKSDRQPMMLNSRHTNILNPLPPKWECY